jgi:hypothetical protein
VIYFKNDLKSILSLTRVCKVWKRAIIKGLKELVLDDDILCQPIKRIRKLLQTFTSIEQLNLSTSQVFKRSIFIPMKKYLRRLNHLECKFSFAYDNVNLSNALASLKGLTFLDFRCKTFLPPSCCTLFDSFSNLTNLKVCFIDHSTSAFHFVRYTLVHFSCFLFEGSSFISTQCIF